MINTGSTEQPKYNRVLLKLSGESLQDKEADRSINPETVNYIIEQISKALELGVQIGIVIGGGNIFRGLTASAGGMERTKADYMGMMATLINSVALQDAFEKKGIDARVFSAIKVDKIAELFETRKVLAHITEGGVAIFAAGTGNPFFTTDTAAALRAAEIGAEIIFKATRVDGVYEADPEKVENAVLYKEISYSDVLQRNLKVMDSTAISLCKDNNIPIRVFNLNKDGNIFNALIGKKIGTVVSKNIKNGGS